MISWEFYPVITIIIFLLITFLIENESDEYNVIMCVALLSSACAYPAFYFLKFMCYEITKARATYSRLINRFKQIKNQTEFPITINPSISGVIEFDEEETKSKKGFATALRKRSTLEVRNGVSSLSSLNRKGSGGSGNLKRNISGPVSLGSLVDNEDNSKLLENFRDTKSHQDSPDIIQMSPSFLTFEFVRYRIDYWFSSSAMSKPIALGAASLALIIFGAFMMYLAGKNTFIASLWTSWTFVADPGTHVDETEFMERVIAFFLTLGGMLIFALLIGIIAEEIGQQVDGLKKGKSRVMEVDHTLICGWSGKTLPILKELIIANESEGGGLIVLLADQDKEEMEQMIKEADIDFKGSEVVCRSGNGLTINGLKKVSAHLAKSIIILADESSQDADGSDARSLRAVLSLMGLFVQYDSTCHIVVEVRDIDNKNLIEIVGQARVECVVAHDVIGRLMIQSSRQPALAHILAEILSFDGSEIYIKHWAELTGLTFADALFRFKLAIPIGVKRKIEHNRFDILLNPKPDFVIGEEDEIIILAEDDDSYSPGESFKFQLTSDQKSLDVSLRKRGPEKMLYCNWRRDIDDMIFELDKVVSPGSELWIYASTPIKKRDKLLEEGGLDLANLKNVKLVHKEGNTVVRRQLETLPIQDFNSILILADENYENNVQDADSRSLSTLLIIREIQQIRQGVPCTLVSEILDAQTMSLVKVAKVSDYIMSNDIVSSVIAQVSENRDMNKVWGELLTDEGMEMYMRPVSRYINVKVEVSFAHIMAAALEYGEICIGYKKYGMDAVLNPPEKSSLEKWSANDIICVIADD